MRKMRRAGVMAAACAMTVLWSAPGASSSEQFRVVDVRDECDPASFNAVLGDGICTGSGDVSFARFVEALNPKDFGHHAWRFNPDDTEIHKGGQLKAVNRGGEFHTFTEVAAFGPGCVPELNEPLGLVGPPAADCGLAFGTTALPAGAGLNVAGLSVGTHRFQCMIHPWMRTKVVVRHR